MPKTDPDGPAYVPPPKKQKTKPKPKPKSEADVSSAKSSYNKKKKPTKPASTTPGTTASGKPHSNLTVTQGFGNPSRRYKSGKHSGIDISLAIGTPLAAPISGKVIQVGNTGKSGWGIFVVVQSADGRTFRYGHLSKASVKVGDSVTRSTIVGYSGNTGQSTGPHLHFEMKDSSGALIDPTDYILANTPVAGARVARPPGYIPGASSNAASNATYSGLRPNASDAETIDFIKDHYGSLAAWLEVPEIRSLLLKGVKAGWTADRIQAEMTNTSWWKARNAASRQWELLDPKTKATQIQSIAHEMAEFWNKETGGNWSPDLFMGDAEQVARGGVPMNVWQFRTRAKAEAIPNTPASKAKAQLERQPKVDVENLTGQLEDLARNQFLVPITRDDARKWAEAIYNKTSQSGTTGADEFTSDQDFTDWLRTQAAGLFPAFAAAIARGVDPATLMSPYRSMASEELERVVDWTDPVLTDIISAQPNKETGGPLGLSSYRQLLRQRPEWKFTTRANEITSDRVASLLQMMKAV